MAFACRAATNSQATPDNLARWGRIVDPRCKLCTHSPCTLGHTLSSCTVALNQERFDYRHDSVLLYLLTALSSLGWKASSSTPTLRAGRPMEAQFLSALLSLASALI